MAIRRTPHPTPVEYIYIFSSTQNFYKIISKNKANNKDFQMMSIIQNIFFNQLEIHIIF